MKAISESSQTTATRSHSLSAKAYVFALVGAYVAVFCAIASINLLVDPYGVFGTDLLVANNVNERFAKIRYLDAHNADYDTYIFGSSTVGLTQPAVVEKYLPGSKIYNLYVSNGDMSDYVDMLQYMLRSKYPVKTVVLQLDPDAFLRPATATRSDYSRRHYPQVSGESKLKFYSDYLFSFSPKYVWEKVEANIHHLPYNIDVAHTGTWGNPRAELAAPADWVANEPLFKSKVAPEYKGEALEAKLDLLKQFLKLARDNNVKTIVMTQATNHVSMDYLDLAAYEKFLRAAASFTSFWDFGGYNTITNNDENYYDIHHARPSVSTLMMAQVFSDRSIPRPADFGVLVTPETVNEIIAQRQHNVVSSR